MAPEMKVNLGAEKRSFEAVPDDFYLLEVVGFRNDTVKGTSGEGKVPVGTQMLVLEAKINEPEEYVNRRIFKNYIIHETTIFSFENLLNALGVETPDDPEDRGNFEVDTNQLVGGEFVGDVRTREYEGTLQNNLQREFPVDSHASRVGSKQLAASEVA